MNKQTERMSMTEILKACYILQRRSDDPLIALDAVESDHRSGNLADSFLAFRTKEEADAFRRAMQADQFQVVELSPEVWLDAYRSFLQEGLTYISLPELVSGTVVKKSVRLADILAISTRLRGSMATWTPTAGIEKIC
jgi:hypothetical protein